MKLLALPQQMAPNAQLAANPRLNARLLRPYPDPEDFPAHPVTRAGAI
ncbi:MAG: hypothetical protein IMF06_01500 [Proteobacteria bacterium]|nr:hypothetical protein [Pseudomonadota bacterium]